MVRSLTLIPAILCASGIVWAQVPADRPVSEPAAQSSTPAPQSATPASDREGTAANKITYSGCVKPGPTPGTFILENADLVPAVSVPGAPASPAAVGTSGTMKATLNLNPKAGVDLKTHANHKIEVMGTMGAPKPVAGYAPPAGQSTKPALDFNVDSIKMVSTSCP